jgi:hypothetical protein
MVFFSVLDIFCLRRRRLEENSSNQSIGDKFYGKRGQRGDQNLPRKRGFRGVTEENERTVRE